MRTYLWNESGTVKRETTGKPSAPCRAKRGLAMRDLEWMGTRKKPSADFASRRVTLDPGFERLGSRFCVDPRSICHPPPGAGLGLPAAHHSPRAQASTSQTRPGHREDDDPGRAVPHALRQLVERSSKEGDHRLDAKSIGQGGQLLLSELAGGAKSWWQAATSNRAHSSPDSPPDDVSTRRPYTSSPPHRPRRTRLALRIA